MIEFKNKTIYITGASGGIAVSCIRKFYQGGANLVLTDLNLAALEKVAQELFLAPERILLMTQDVSVSGEAASVVKAAIEKFGKIDILVPCAGLYIDNLLQDMSDEEWRRVISVNLDGVFFTIREVIPHLSSGGAIVNVTSMAGHKGSFMHGHYAAAKGAVLTLTRTLALELAPNIRVNNVSPGLIDTPMVQRLMAEKGTQLIDQTPLKRLGSSDEVADAIIYLASDYASFITGETLHVNGGLYVTS